MGRGLAWTAEEAGDLARAWIAATEDPVLGIDQTSTHFNQGMYSSFCSFAPDGACAKQYSGRGARPSRAKWDSISADCQKFRSALRFIRMCEPSGVTEDNIFSMAVAKHLGKRSTMSYDARDYPYERCNNHLAFKVLRRVPKFQDQNDSEPIDSSNGDGRGTVTSVFASVDATGNAADNRGSNGGEAGLIENEKDSTDVSPNAVTPSGSGTVTEGRAMSGGHYSRKRAKKELYNQKFDQITLQNARVMAKSMRRRVELMEEKNAMHAFSVGQFNTEEEKRDRDEFFRLTRIDHLRRLRERNSDETGTSSATTVPPRRGPPSVTTVVPLAGSNTF